MATHKPEEDMGATAPLALRFDLVELETFLAVVELGSFSLAARRLHISQPSVTSRVQRLESTLRTRLLIRTTRHVAPTPAGQRLRERAEKALADLRGLLHEFQSDAEEARRRVVIASTPMIAAVMLPSLIHSFCMRYPDVQIQLRDLQYEDVVARIETGDVDLGVVAFDNDSNKLSFEALTQEDMLVVVPHTHALATAGKVTLEQLASMPMMLLDRYSMLRQTLADAFQQRGLTLRPMHQATNLSTLLGMVDAGLGATLLPQSMAQRYARDSRATLQLSDVNLSRSFGILRSRHGELSPAALSFVRHLEANFGSTLTSDAPIA